MKSSQRYVTLVATVSLTLAGTALAQSNRSSAGTIDASLGAIARVTKDSVKNRFTAKDLIGASVYDLAGDKIGDIADIDLQGSVPGTLASSFNLDHATAPSGSRPTPAAGTIDATRDPSRSNPLSGPDSALAHATVFLSVGGLWGMGDDLVRVPMSKFSYNMSKDRFELDATKADVVALAEGETRSGYAADAPISGTSAGKQSFADEASRVQESLQSDPQTSAFAHNVTVTTDGETLRIHGMVDNKEQEKRILDAARRATSLKVDDEIDVRK